MFGEYLKRILGSERGLGSNRQVYATPDVIEKSSTPSKPIPSKYEKDIEALKENMVRSFSLLPDSALSV